MKTGITVRFQGAMIMLHENHNLIWRYLTLSKFISLLHSQSLFLCRADHFEDRTEGEWFAHLSTKSQVEVGEHFSSGLGAIRRINDAVSNIDAELTVEELQKLIGKTISPNEYAVLDDTDDLYQLFYDSFLESHEDRLEWLNYIQEKHEDLVGDCSFSAEDRESIVTGVKSLKSRSYVSSWFGGYNQCMAMWKTYCSGDEGVAITTTKSKLKGVLLENRKTLLSLKANSEAFDVVYVSPTDSEIGRIIPRDLPDGVWLEFRDLMLKHSAYEYEREHRLVVTLPKAVVELPNGITLNISNGLDAFIDQVYLPPTISEGHWLHGVVNEVMVKFGLDQGKLTVGEIKTMFTPS